MPLVRPSFTQNLGWLCHLIWFPETFCLCIDLPPNLCLCTVQCVCRCKFMNEATSMCAGAMLATSWSSQQNTLEQRGEPTTSNISAAGWVFVKYSVLCPKISFQILFLFIIVSLKLCYSNLMKQCPISSGVRNSDSKLHTGQCFDIKYKQEYQLTNPEDNAQYFLGSGMRRPSSRAQVHCRGGSAPLSALLATSSWKG